jgi:hypothetical protein
MLSQLSYSPTGFASYRSPHDCQNADALFGCLQRSGVLPCVAILPEWRNWHTQGPQKAPVARPCGFESHLRYRGLTS